MTGRPPVEGFVSGLLYPPGTRQQVIGPVPWAEAEAARRLRGEAPSAVLSPEALALIRDRVTGQAAPPGYPDGLDGWLDAHPGAEVWMEGQHWHGSCPLSRGTALQAGPVPRASLRAAMEELAGRAAACQAIEADWPPWLAGVAQDGGWLACRTLPGGTVAKVTGPDEAGLREAIAAAQTGLAGGQR